MFHRQSYQLRQLIERLNQRERYLLLAVIFVLMVMVGQLILMATGLDNHDTVRDRLTQTREQTQALQQALIDYQAAIDNPRIRALQDSNEDLSDRIEDLEGRIADINSQLMSPERMISLLKELLNDYSNLTVTRFEVLPVNTIESNVDGGNLFYRHGLRIEMEGQFEALNNYLAAIEGLEGQLFWDDLIVETENFPTLNIRLEVHTLSQDEEWLNV